jgi:hypothetical protein
MLMGFLRAVRSFGAEGISAVLVANKDTRAYLTR